jgi:hypothetical protein
MDNMRYDMLDYLRGKAPSEIKDILARHEAVAAAQFWEEKFRASGTSLMLCGSLIEEIIRRIKARNGLCVLAFDAKMLRQPTARKNIEDVLKAAYGKDLLKVVIFRDAEEDAIPPGIRTEYEQTYKATFVTRKAGDNDITTQIRKALNRPDASVAIAISDSIGVFNRIEGDIQGKNIKDTASYILAKTDSKIGEINLVNLLRALVSNAPSFVALGYGPSEKSKFDDIKRIFKGLFTFITDPLKALSEMFYALRATSISV